MKAKTNAKFDQGGIRTVSEGTC